VSFSGSWLGKDTVYVRDRYVDGKRGFWVVTPVLVGDSAMPVVRGWSAETQAPPVAGNVTVTGWLQATEGDGALDDDPTDDVIPTMRVASLVEHVDADLYSGYVVARTATSGTDGLRRVTPAAIPSVSGFTALRNLLYAIEWWVFGAFAVFVWLRWCRDTLHPEEDDEA
jgi:cytochrome oxidase assembly protein ShyY1